ncbi:pal1 cell morphology protein domain-containing protein [Trichoderma breve]|uniref:Pal1 cell morphology protein domain-containing protein n=1 Tax=Trichoderma breve TaxID=2034170 RepID=A0A9W9EAD5_9HYPO|nr:pal1 cell morphology protein domain-containing protein [Trichoderma breve]KAJ4863001.1 pal1 cell morphology protein domain-containing protein [Trichoderma breve]
MYDSDGIDKDWARKYILDPLTAPEPSEETGLGSSHYNPHRISLQALPSHTRQRPASPASSSSSFSDLGDRTAASYPTPPSTGNPEHKFSQRKRLPPPPSANHTAQHSVDSHCRPMMRTPNAASPESNFHPTNPFVSSPQSSNGKVLGKQASMNPHNRSNSELGHHSQPGAHKHSHRRPRTQSLGERFPGDMSHRPLDIIINDTRAADRQRRHRPRVSETDVIDALDTVGGMYHHGGPYDATLRSRNLDPRTSPVAAVQESNMEALRATPREYVMDSLRHHVPLQGTSTIPSGEYDYRGSRMSYEEGADLMREPDAPGGPYKRYADTKYHPDDLKGKGEPSYSLERALKEKKRAKNGEPDEIEMQTGLRSRNPHSKSKHQRSMTVALRGSSSATGNAYNDSELERRNSTGKKISDSLKRRWGSIRGRK